MPTIHKENFASRQQEPVPVKPVVRVIPFPNEAQNNRVRNSNLSSRELECLSWSSKGKTDAEIGMILGIAARTARFHSENAKRKMGVATRAQAVAEYVRNIQPRDMAHALIARADSYKPLS